MKKTIISFLAIVFAFAILFTASPPVAAETGKSFQKQESARSFPGNFRGDIPISAVKFCLTAETEFLIRSDETRAASVAINYGLKRSRQISAKNPLDASVSFNPPESLGANKFINNRSSDGFRGFGDDTQARFKV